MRMQHNSHYLSVIANLQLIVCRVMIGVAVTTWLLALAYGLYTNQFLLALTLASLLFVVAPVVCRFYRASASAQAILVVALMLMVSLHVHLLGGMIEAHFGYFVILAISIAYFSARVIVAGAGTAIVLHLLMHGAQSLGLPIYLFPPGHHSIGIVLLHAMYVVLEAVVLIGVVWLFKPLVETARVIVQVTRNEKLEIPHDHECNENPLQRRLYRVLAEHRTILHRSHHAYTENSERLSSLQQVSEEVSTHASNSLQSIHHINDALEDITHSVTDVAEQSKRSAELAGDLAQSKTQAHQRGLQVLSSVGAVEQNMATVTQSVHSLEHDCEQVAGVLKEVQGITDQTNLLALNAAIEAARAGEHGRGFAVVAEHVRSLAGRTLEATGRISLVIQSLIKSSQQTSGDIQAMHQSLNVAVEDSESVEQALNTMSAQIDDIVERVTHISDTTQQQRETAVSITATIGHIEQTSKTTLEHAKTTHSLLNDITLSFGELKMS